MRVLRPVTAAKPRLGRLWLVPLALVFAFAAAIQLALGATPRNDFLLVFDRRAGPYHYLDSFRRGHPHAYEAALVAFGSPSRFRVDGNLCRVTWAAAGITVGFASELNPCAAAHLFEAAWYGMSLSDSRWHNRLGLRVGMTLAQVRRLYPGGRFESASGGAQLALLHRRDQELLFTTLAVGLDRSGRVVSIEVPAAYIY